MRNVDGVVLKLARRRAGVDPSGTVHVRGRVASASKVPLPAWVTAERPCRENSPANARILRGCPVPEHGQTAAQGQVSSDGSFDLGHLRAGDYTLLLRSAQTGTVGRLPLKIVAGKPPPTVVIEAEPAATLAGSVNGLPAGFEGQVWLVVFDATAVSKQVRVAADGSFVVTGLPAGTFGLRVGHDHFAARANDLAVHFDFGQHTGKVDAWRGAVRVRVANGAVMRNVQVPYLPRAKSTVDGRSAAPRVVPDKVTRQRIRKEVCEYFAVDPRQPAEVQRAMIGKLRRDAARTTDDAQRYVMLAEAYAAALRVGDGVTALEVVRDLEKDFALRGGSMRLDAIESLCKGARTAADAYAVAELCIAELDRLAREDDRLARGAVRSFSQLARLARSSALSQHARQLGRDLDEAATLRPAVAGALAILATKPDDRAANQQVGSFRCFRQGDWDSGLPHLARGSDAPLRALAALELNESDAPGSAIRIGDGWWKQGEQYRGEVRSRVRNHAAAWYRRAIDQVRGHDRARAQARIDKMVAETRALLTPARLDEPSSDGLVGRWLFDDGADQGADSSGKGNHGKLVNGVKWVEGVVGQALSFDGRDDHVTIAVADLPALNGPITIAWYQWVADKPKSQCNPIALCNWKTMTSIQPGYGRNGDITVWRLSGDPLVSCPPPPVRQWHHCAYTFDGKTHRLYIDARLKDVSTASQRAGVPHVMEFGRWRGKKYSSFFRGRLDEVRIYRRVLEQREIRRLLRPVPR